MTVPHPQPEYIITEERVKNLIYIVYRDGGEERDDDIHEALKGIRSRPVGSEAREKVLEQFVKKVELKHGEMVDLMRRNKMKIDNLKDPMQKLAFTFFSEIGEMSHEAETILAELREQQGEREQG